MRNRNEIFKKNIATLRTDLGLNQTEAASRCGTSAANWNRWERGVSVPDIAQVMRIASGFGVSADWLLTGETAHADLQPRQVGRPAVTGISQPVLDFLGQLTPDEQRELLVIGPPLLRIYRAQQDGDPQARQAWGFLKGNMEIFDRAVSLRPPKQRRIGGGSPKME